MPDYKLHILFGILFAAAVIYLLYSNNLFNFTLQDFIFIAPMLFIYSILPDIDISSSKISKLVRIIALLLLIVSLYYDQIAPAAIICAILLILEFISHRQFIHSVAAAVLFSLPLLYFNYIIALFAFIGYFSHLLLDRQVAII